MKWNRYSIKTTTAAIDFISSALADIGIEGIEIQDNVQLTQEEAKTMFVDFIPELPPDDGTAVVNFYIDSDEDDGTLVKKAKQELEDLRMKELSQAQKPKIRTGLITGNSIGIHLLLAIYILSLHGKLLQTI